MLTLDHIAVGCEALRDGVDYVQSALGVTLQQGGKHAAFGTHNMLLGLGPDLYLEVIAPDPDAAPYDGPRWFDLDQFKGPPRLANWICRTPDLTTAPAVAGPARALSRGDLHWQITVPADGSLPHGGAFPTLIRWGDGVTPPAAGLTDAGCRLTGWTVTHPDADGVAGICDIADPRVRFVTGPVAGFTATFDTPSGPKVLT